MRGYRTWLRPLVKGILLWGGGICVAQAAPSPVPFTWNPAAAGLAGSAFTADTINITGYVRDDTIVANRIEVITGFSLGGGASFTPAGLGTSYGLYFQAADKGIAGPPPNIMTFTSVAFTLRADPGNQNGAVISTPASFGFANTGATGQADDIVLATGSLIKGALVLDIPNGVLNSDIVHTYQSAVAGFLTGGSGFMDAVAVNPASLLQFTPRPGDTTVTNFNGYAGTAQFIAVPEPQTVLLLSAGLLGLGLARRSRA